MLEILTWQNFDRVNNYYSGLETSKYIFVLKKALTSVDLYLLIKFRNDPLYYTVLAALSKTLYGAFTMLSAIYLTCSLRMLEIA